MSGQSDKARMPLVLILDSDVLARSAIANYLRECGHEVVEVRDELEAKMFLGSTAEEVDIAILAVAGDEPSATMEFSRWLREKDPSIRTLLAATVEKEAKIAADICEEGPHLRKPYEPQALVDWIKRLRR